MTNEEIDKKLAEVDASFAKVEAAKRELLAKVDECSAEQLRLQGEYRAYKAMKPAEVPVVEPVVT